MKRLFYIIILMLALPTTLQGQSTTSAGRDFWVAFIVNGGAQRPQQTQICATSENACTITVSNPLTGWSQSVPISAGSNTFITLPNSDAIPEQYSTIESKGFHVTATDNIFLTATLSQLASNGVATILPTSTLGTRYIVLDYPTDAVRTTSTQSSGATVTILATEDNTTIHYIPPCPLYNSPSSVVGSTVTYTFSSAGQTLTLMASQDNATLSGMEITSDKPIAVFQGNQLTGVPHSSPSGDYLYDQSIPVTQWGTEYPLIPTFGRTVGDKVRVVADSACTITLSTGTSYTLAANGVQEFDLSASTPSILSSDKPVSVGLCMKGSAYGGEPGDGSLVMASPTNRGISHCLFPTFTTERIHDWYVAIATDQPAMMTLDGNNIATQFQPVGSTGYYYARISVSSGVHSLVNQGGTFSGWAYGKGNVESYAFSLGYAFDNETEDPPASTSCPDHTTVGDDFWVTFIPNGHSTTSSFSVIATGLDDATITVTNPRTGWSTTATHTGGTKTYIELPSMAATSIPSAAAANQGFHVTSTSDISLYASNYIVDSWDVCNILPTSRLTSQYIVQDYPNNSDYTGAMALVATEDNTVFTMVLPCPVDGLSMPVGSTYTVTLNAGQTLALKCGANVGFSGMTVTSNNKPFALFQGHSCARVGTDDTQRGRDHIMEQAIPLDWWGREFVVVSEQARTEGDRVRITASENNTSVNIVGPGGNNTFSLNAGQTHEYHLPANSAAYITSTQPVYVCKYLISFDKFNPTSLGDPASVDIPPVHNWLCSTTFPVHNCNSNPSSEQYITNDHHYLDIVTTTAAADSMRLDGLLLPSSQFTVLTGTPYCYYHGQVTPGAHTIDNSAGPFYATVSGHARWVAYAFLAGMGLEEVEPGPLEECLRGNGQGTDFWATFLCNDDDPANAVLSLIATGAHQASVVVSNPVTGWTQTVSLTPGNKVQITLPTANTIPSGQLHNIGYHITSSAPITLYASNYKEGSLDYSQVFPTYTIDDHYIVQNYPNNSDHPANVAFVATEDSTQLSMVLPCAVTGLSLSAGSLYMTTLNIGQSLLLRATPGGDFSGMEVTSNCKHFALFQGCAAGRVGDNTTSTGRDHFFEQAMPTFLWGTEFVADASLDRNEGDRVIVTSSDDNCTIQINDTIVTTLMRGQSHEYTLVSNTTAHIVTSKPSYACLYLTSYRNGGTKGDPGAATLPPVNRWVCNSNFMLHQNNNNPSSQYYIANPYINIVAETAVVGTLTLDGTIIPPSQFSPIAGTPYSHARMHINYGAHSLDAGDAGTFSARVYGLGKWAGYAYNIDMLLDTAKNCIPEIHRDTLEFRDSVCQGESYSNNGFDISAEQTASPGTITAWDSTVVDDTVIHYRHLSLTVLPTSHGVVSMSIVAGDTLFFADTALTLAGSYPFVFTAANGCDSVVVLVINYEEVGLRASADGVCPGEAVVLTAEGTRTFHWESTPPDPELDSLQGQNPITVHPSTTTTYYLLDAANNIIASITVGTAPPPIPCVESNRDFIDFDHPVITLHDCSENRHTTTWTFSDGLHFTGERVRRQFHRPLPDTITITMTTCNRYNCCADTTIGFSPKIRSVWFPNVFTPDADINNRFSCFTSMEVVSFELFIYNRWGLLVWQTNDVNQGWNGTHDGTPVQQGAYVYRWHLKDIYGDRHNGIGTVTLLR